MPSATVLPVWAALPQSHRVTLAMQALVRAVKDRGRITQIVTLPVTLARRLEHSLQLRIQSSVNLTSRTQSLALTHCRLAIHRLTVRVHGRRGQNVTQHVESLDRRRERS